MIYFVINKKPSLFIYVYLKKKKKKKKKEIRHYNELQRYYGSCSTTAKVGYEMTFWIAFRKHYVLAKHESVTVLRLLGAKLLLHQLDTLLINWSFEDH